MKNVEAVIFDWAGTVVDFGSFAPTTIFVEAFKKAFDFDITLKEARGPMGLGKWDHIRALGDDKEISERWQQQFSQPMNNDDVDRIYRTFLPLQIDKVIEHSDLIPGADKTIAWLRDESIKIGSCSGYPKEVLNVLREAARTKGFDPDHVVATGDLLAGGRPGPWMALDNVIALKASNVAHCIKVDDSAPGITEGRNAGMWTVGLTLSGNESGMTLDEYLQATDDEKARAREKACTKLIEANAHYLIDTIAELPEIVEQINQRLQNGERP